MATQTTLGTGLGSFFKTLGSGGAIRQQAQDERMGSLLKQAFLGEKTEGQGIKNRITQYQADALPQLGEAFANSGLLPEGANPYALAQIVRAGGKFNPQQIGKFTGDAQAQHLLNQGVNAYRQGDTGLSNVSLAAGGAKPIDYTDVKGNVAFNPNVTPGQAEIQATPVGQSVIAKNKQTGGGLTPTQASHNEEIDAARQVVTKAGLTKAELQKRTQQYTQTGMPNPDYDPTLSSTVHQAMQRKVGDDPTYDTIYRNFYGGGEATDTPPVQGARKAPDGNWYVSDPDRPGKYLRVDTVGQQIQPTGTQQIQPTAYTFTANDGTTTTLSAQAMQQVAQAQGVSLDELIRLLDATPQGPQ